MSGIYCCSVDYKTCLYFDPNSPGTVCMEDEYNCNYWCHGDWIEEGSCSGLPKYADCSNNQTACCPAGAGICAYQGNGTYECIGTKSPTWYPTKDTISPTPVPSTTAPSFAPTQADIAIEGTLTPYLGWIAFLGLVIIYAVYEAFNFMRSCCEKPSSSQSLEAHLMINGDVEDNKEEQDEEDTELDAFKPSIFNSFLDIQDIINSSIFTAYFYINTGYALNSAVGNIQILLFCVEIFFQIIDLYVCIAWYFNYRISKKLIVNYYRFKIIVCNFNFLQMLFKLYYSFDHLHQNMTFYNIVFSLTMVFRSYWMLLIDFIEKAESSDDDKKVSKDKNKGGIKNWIKNKAKYGLLQLVIVTPLFYLVNTVVLGLEVINNRILMLIYCILWFISPWIYFISTKVSNKCGDNNKCDVFMKYVIGVSQCFMSTIMFIIGVVGGIFVSIPQLQFTITMSLYGFAGSVFLLKLLHSCITKGSYKDILTCFFIIYALPFFIAIGFFIVGGIMETESDAEYEGSDYDENNDGKYEPIEPEIIPRH